MTEMEAVGVRPLADFWYCIYDLAVDAECFRTFETAS